MMAEVNDDKYEILVVHIDKSRGEVQIKIAARAARAGAARARAAQESLCHNDIMSCHLP